MSAVRVDVPAALGELSTALAEAPVDRVEAAVRTRLADYVAAVVGGSSSAAAHVVRRLAASAPGTVDAPGGRTTAEHAALGYGIAAHALESDDTHQPSSTHPGSVIFSAVLPLAAEGGLALADVGGAVVAGYEVMCRLGEAAGAAEQYARGFHPTGTCGVFGAAGAAALILDGDRETVANAISLAVACSSGSMAFLQGGGWSKLLNAGHAASAGIGVARLSALGYRGPRESVEGPHGFLVGHSARPDVSVFDRPLLDEPWAIERTSVKAHGCCRYEQGPVDAILAARRRHPFGADDVAGVDVGMLRAGWGIVAEPLDEKRRPATVVDSQFSMPFGAALALLYGRAAASDHTASNLADPRVRHLMDLVDCHRDDALDARYPRSWPSTVRITLRDGTVLEEEVEHPKGDPENPITAEELVTKARALAPPAAAEGAATLAERLLTSRTGDIRVADVLAELRRLAELGEG